MSSLYEIGTEYLDIVAMLEQAEGELTPEQEEMILINDEDFENKVKSYRGIIRSMTDQLVGAKAERDRVIAFEKKIKKLY